MMCKESIQGIVLHPDSDEIIQLKICMVSPPSWSPKLAASASAGTARPERLLALKRAGVLHAARLTLGGSRTLKRREALIVACVLVACVLVAGRVTRAVEAFRGSWTLRGSDEPGRIQFALIRQQHGHSSIDESTWPLSALVGLDTLDPASPGVKFTVTRDAGRLLCEGRLNNREGAGVFQYLADSKFWSEMSSMGFIGIDEETQFSMMAVDVTLAFAREMKAEHLQGLDSDMLTEAAHPQRRFPPFVRGFRDAGMDVRDCGRLVAFRIHGVTPEMVRFLHSAGYQPAEDDLIALRIHGTTPEWIQELRAEGYERVGVDDLVAFRIHSVSPEFIRGVQTLGYGHPQSPMSWSRCASMASPPSTSPT